VLTGAGPPNGCASKPSEERDAQDLPTGHTHLERSEGVPFQWLQPSDAQRAALDPGVSSSGTRMAELSAW